MTINIYLVEVKVAKAPLPVIMFARFSERSQLIPVATFSSAQLAKQYIKKNKNKRGNFKQASLLAGAERKVRLVSFGTGVPHNPGLGDINDG